MIFLENTESYLRDLATRVDSIDRIALNQLADQIAAVEAAASGPTAPVVHDIQRSDAV